MHQYVSENQLLAAAACEAIESGRADALAETMTRFQELFDRTAAVVGLTWLLAMYCEMYNVWMLRSLLLAGVSVTAVLAQAA